MPGFSTAPEVTRVRRSERAKALRRARARAAGIDQAFIPGGIHGEALQAPMGTLPSAERMAALAAEFGFAPTYMLAELRW